MKQYRRAAGERLVPAAGGLALAAAGWLAAGTAGLAPPTWGWVLVPASMGLTVAACLRAARGAHPPAVARFWRQIALSAALTTASCAVRAYLLIVSAGPADNRVFRSATVLALAAMLIDAWALCRLPLGLNGRAGLTAFLLDIGTVMTGAGLFFWEVVYRRLFTGGAQDQGAVMMALTTIALTQVAVFVLAKVALTGSVTVDAGALRLFGLALILGTLGTAPDAFLSTHTQLTVAQVSLPLVCWIVVLAARRQWRAAGRTAGPVAAPRRRAYSLLPYAAVLATEVLLVVSALYADRAERAVVAAGTVVLVSLVLLRQATAFREIARLLARLDRGMAELRVREHRFRSLVQNSTDVTTIADARGFLTYVSPSIVTVLGYEPAELAGRHGSRLVHPEDRSTAYRWYAGIAERPGATTCYQVRVAHADGTWRWMEITSANLLHERGVAGVVSNARDVTQARQFQQRLTHQASHDALTGLANRALFAERLAAALAVPGSARPAVILIDLNDFKKVNDGLGHAAGDGLLVAVARRLRRLAPPGATVARLGGDEFAILVDDATEDALAELGECLVERVGPPPDEGERWPRVGASVGIAHHTADPATQPVAGAPDELMRRADMAMYAAKAAGERGESRCAHHTSAMDAALAARGQLERELRALLEGVPVEVLGELYLAYQPIVRLPGGDGRGDGPAGMVAVEALLRWEHPRRGEVPPGEVVPVAERTGLIVPLGRWILAQACRQAVAWYREHGERSPTMNVNVSARQLRDPEFIRDVDAVLRETGLPPRLLTIEVTESLVVADAASFRTLDELNGRGVRISLDDFGTGQSALALLDRCPVDELKLDRSFTQGCTDPGRRRVAAAVVGLAGALGLDLIAEGVETPDQARELAHLGYRRAQGFHFFATPLRAAEAARMISAGRPGPPLGAAGSPVPAPRTVIAGAGPPSASLGSAVTSE
ncbi:putative bifunctional diguanylate cyclase/phosphodiesterase [Rhizomonospora bruguierae]|uniref:putative bifunctional diguanylate cyclase/phosphodiesterase n=1 Tax=Rhizomonospora bruguierae TaxID=1581705 RepID=UPI001BCCA9EC|nr:EAL domain-containing protein [Micromonospora sp. NBRC 107566]